MTRRSDNDCYLETLPVDAGGAGHRGDPVWLARLGLAGHHRAGPAGALRGLRPGGRRVRPPRLAGPSQGREGLVAGPAGCPGQRADRRDDLRPAGNHRPGAAVLHRDPGHRGRRAGDRGRRRIPPRDPPRMAAGPGRHRLGALRPGRDGLPGDRRAVRDLGDRGVLDPAGHPATGLRPQSPNLGSGPAGGTGRGSPRGDGLRPQRWPAQAQSPRRGICAGTPQCPGRLGATGLRLRRAARPSPTHGPARRPGFAKDAPGQTRRAVARQPDDSRPRGYPGGRAGCFTASGWR
jgi:hypothetical protein